MKIEGLTPRQWRLYNYLKDNAVGKANLKSGTELCEALGYGNKQTLQLDIRALRIALTRKIASNNFGYWLPTSPDDDDNFKVAKALGHIYTALADGSLTKDLAHRFIQSVDVSKPLDNQLKFVFGDYEKDIAKRYSDDLIEDKTKPIAEALVGLTEREKEKLVNKRFKEYYGFLLNLPYEILLDEVKKYEATHELQ